MISRSFLASLVLASAVLLGVGGFHGSALHAATPPAPGPFAPPLTGVDQYGREIRLRDLRGKWVVLAFSSAATGSSRQMALEAQPLTDLLRQNGVPFVYVTALMQDSHYNVATERAAADWAAEYHLTGPVLSPGAFDASNSILWQQFVRYVSTQTSQGFSDFFAIGFVYPEVVILDPQGRIVANSAGGLTAQEVLGYLGKSSLTLPAVQAPPHFTLDGFDFAFSSQSLDPTPGTVNTGSRAEPSTDSGFTTGTLPATLTCVSASSDDFFRVSRSFTLEHFQDVDGLGLETDLMGFDLSNLQWGDAGPGVLDTGSATLEFRDGNSGESRRFAVPIALVQQPNGKVTIAPLHSSQVITDPNFASSYFDRVKLTLDWTVRADPVLIILEMEQRIAALNLPANVQQELLGLARAARLATAPGSGAREAIAGIATLSRRLHALSGRQLDAGQVASLNSLADDATTLLSAHPPAPAPAVFPTIAAKPSTGSVSSLFKVGEMAPLFADLTQYGTLSLKKLRGKWVVLDFCTVWCGPCRHMVAQTRPLTDLLKAQGAPCEYVTMLTENGDHGPSTLLDAFAWAERFAVSTPILTAGGTFSSQISRLYNGYALAAPDFRTAGPGVPLVVIIDPQGRIAKIISGEVTSTQICQFIKQSNLTVVDHLPTFDLLGYDAEVEYSDKTATFKDASLQQVGIALTADSGDAPANLNLGRGTARDISVVQETLTVGLDLGDADPTALSHQIPLGITIKNPNWAAAGPGYFLDWRVSATLTDDTTGAFLNNVFSATDLSPAHFRIASIDSLLIPADFAATSFTLQFSWVRNDPDTLLPYLLLHLPEVGLSPSHTVLLLVPLRAALGEYQVNSNRPAALAKVKRFKTQLTGMELEAANAALVLNMKAAADILIQQLSAP